MFYAIIFFLIIIKGFHIVYLLRIGHDDFTDDIIM